MLSAFLPLVYIQISPELLTVRNVKTGTTVAEIPELAISTSGKPVILAVGPQARLAAASEPAKVSTPLRIHVPWSRTSPQPSSCSSTSCCGY